MKEQGGRERTEVVERHEAQREGAREASGTAPAALALMVPVSMALASAVSSASARLLAASAAISVLRRERTAWG